MGPQFLIDTNTVIDLIGNRLPPAGAQWLQQLTDAEAHCLSVINHIELLSRPATPAELLPLELYIDASPIIQLDADIVRATIRLRQQYRRKLPDALIAATALVHRLTIVTRNVSDFAAIAGLQVINPYEGLSDGYLAGPRRAPSAA